MEKVAVYTLLDPRTKAVRYVGKAQEPKERLEEHISQARNVKGQLCHRLAWLRQLARANLRPLLRTVERCCETVWQERERFWIAEYRRRGADLVNATDGGDEVDGYKHTDKDRVKMSASHKPLAPEVEARRIKAVRAAITGRERTPEEREAIRQAALKQWANRQARAKLMKGLLPHLAKLNQKRG